MSEIKYRAWDKETESYLEIGFDFRIDGNGNIYRRSWGETVWDRTQNLIVEQFTGLKDNKEEREIYEGDVYRGAESGWLFLVEFRDGEFILTLKDARAPYRIKHASLHYALFNLDIKWVGNIHQNPKLLGE